MSDEAIGPDWEAMRRIGIEAESISDRGAALPMADYERLLAEAERAVGSRRELLEFIVNYTPRRDTRSEPGLG